jgi:hypothetical protein
MSPTADQVESFTRAATFMSQQDLRWWFAALFLLFVGTGLVVLWMLFRFHRQYIEGLTNQLTDQRTANALINKQLIEYITNDHIQSVQTLKEVSLALKEVGNAIAAFNAKLGAH